MYEDEIKVEEENLEDKIDVKEENVIVNTGGTTDHAKLKNLDYASSGHTGFASFENLQAEITARQSADTNLQGQIDAITVSSDVVDIVATYQELQNYDTTKLTDDDIIKVMQDSTHSNAMSYYRWSSNAWVYVGSEGPFYTKSESDNKFQDKLVSGVNIKTINRESVLGGGNLNIDPAGGANLTPLYVENNRMDLLDFINEAEVAETFTISNEEDVRITATKQDTSDTIYVEKGSIIAVYPQYGATILCSDGSFVYYIDFETEEYLAGGASVNVDTVSEIIDDKIGDYVDLDTAQTITGLKTFGNNGIQFKKTNTNIKLGIEPSDNGGIITYTDAQGTKTNKLEFDNQYTTTDQDIIPRTDVTQSLGKSNKRFGTVYANKINDGTNEKNTSNLITNDGHILPTENRAYTLGSTSKQWNSLYLSSTLRFDPQQNTKIENLKDVIVNTVNLGQQQGATSVWNSSKFLQYDNNNVKCIGKLYGGLDVNNKVIHNISAPDDDTSPISKGYADSHYQGTLTFDSTPTDGSSNPVTSGGVFNSIQNVIEVAEGKTATYTLSYSTTGNEDFNSQNNSITVSSFTDTAGNTITDADVKVGDIVLIVEVDVPDRWVQSIDTTNHTITFYKMETSKIDLNNYVDLTSAQTITGAKTFSSTILPSTNNNIDLGNSSKKWKDLYLSGNISDGTNSVAIADIADKDYVDTAIGDIDIALQNLVSGNGVI